MKAVRQSVRQETRQPCQLTYFTAVRAYNCCGPPRLGMYMRSPGCSSSTAIGSPRSAAVGLNFRSGLGAGIISSYKIHVFDPASCTTIPVHITTIAIRAVGLQAGPGGGAAGGALMLCMAVAAYLAVDPRIPIHGQSQEGRCRVFAVKADNACTEHEAP